MINMIIDATNTILGRLASTTAKKILSGEDVIIINAEKSVITGKKKMVFERFKHKRERGDPKNGPFYPRYPDMILRRVIRGMLPYKKAKGRAALKRLRVYNGNPENFKKIQKIIKSSEELECKYMTLEELSRRMGAKV